MIHPIPDPTTANSEWIRWMMLRDTATDAAIGWHAIDATPDLAPAVLAFALASRAKSPFWGKTHPQQAQQDWDRVMALLPIAAKEDPLAALNCLVLLRGARMALSPLQKERVLAFAAALPVYADARHRIAVNALLRANSFWVLGAHEQINGNFEIAYTQMPQILTCSEARTVAAILHQDMLWRKWTEREFCHFHPGEMRDDTIASIVAQARSLSAYTCAWLYKALPHYYGKIPKTPHLAQVVPPTAPLLPIVLKRAEKRRHRHPKGA